MVMPMLYFCMWVATKKDKGELHYEKVHENGYGRNFILGNGFGCDRSCCTGSFRS